MDITFAIRGPTPIEPEIVGSFRSQRFHHIDARRARRRHQGVYDELAWRIEFA